MTSANWIRLLLMGCCTLPAAAQPGPWHALYDGGPSRWLRFDTVELALDGDALRCHVDQPRAKPLTIPLKDIAEVASEQYSYRYFGDVETASLNWLATTRNLEPRAAVLVAETFVVLQALRPLLHLPKGHRQLVHIVWNSGSGDRAMTLQFDAAQERAFLAELERLRGEPAANVNAARERTLRLLAQAPAIPFKLERTARVAAAELPAGSYLLKFVSQEDGPGLLYWFSSEKGRKPRLLAASFADYYPSADTATEVEFRRTTEPKPQINLLRVPNGVYLLAPGGSCVIRQLWLEEGNTAFGFESEARYCGTPAVRLERSLPLRQIPLG